MSRIIRDSDDEFEDDLEETVQTPALPIENASAKRVDSTPQTNGAGTGSTEWLKKNIEAAHRAHFQSQPEPSLPLQDASNTDLSQSQCRNNRRKTNGRESPTLSREGSQRSVPLETSDRSKTTFSSHFLDENQGRSASRAGIITAGNIWELEGTLREDYVQHEPMALFPEQSSTIENTTQTQQRLLEEVMAPAFLGLESDTEPQETYYQPAKSSVPWSDFLKTQSEEVGSHTHSSTIQERASKDHRDISHCTPPIMSQTPKPSQRSRRDSSVLLKGTPLRNKVDSSTILEELPGFGIGTPSKNSLSRRSGSSQSRRSLSSNKDAPESRHTSLHDENEHLSEIAADPISQATKDKFSSVANANDYLEGLRLSKEQYKARPSRSRSLKGSSETPIDYSVVPEKAGRKRTRRSKRADGARDERMASTPQKVQQICDMGFTPSTTYRALEKNSGDVSQTVDWLVTNATIDDEDELAPPRASKAKTKTPKSSIGEAVSTRPVEPSKDNSPLQKRREHVSLNASTDHKEHITSAILEESTNAAKSLCQATETSEHQSPTVQVVIPKLNRMNEAPESEDPATGSRLSQPLTMLDGAPSKRAKRRKTTHDQPEPLLEEQKEAISEPQKEKKRRRGRPRKEPVAPPVARRISEESEDNDTLEAEAQQSGSRPALQETQPRATLNNEVSEPMDTIDQAQTTSQSVTGKPGSTPPPKGVTAAIEPKNTPEKQTKPANPVHSPLSKGKVSYRVGLSKRARIAPLLRMVKK